MKINGNITLSEGAVIVNATIPRGTVFPANPNIGEKFFLTTALDATHPIGEYTHNGSAWRNLPSLDEIKALISGNTGTAWWRELLTARVGLGAVAAGTAWFTNGATSATNTTLGAAVPLPVVYIDPADYPVGATLRIQAHLFCNSVATTAGFTISLRNITRSSGTAGSTAQVGYDMGATALGPVAFTGTTAAGSIRTGVSAEFAMPATAGLYAFVYVQNAAMTANSAMHISARLQAKF